MTKKKTVAWRHLLAGVLALVFLSAGTALAAPNDTASPAASEVLPAAAEAIEPEHNQSGDIGSLVLRLENSDPMGTWSESVFEFYRSQLTPMEESIYQALKESPLGQGPCVCEVKVDIADQIATEDLSYIVPRAYTALRLDHPEYSWMNRFSCSIESDYQSFITISTDHLYIYRCTLDADQAGSIANEYPDLDFSDPAVCSAFSNTGYLEDIDYARAQAIREIGSLDNMNEYEKIVIIHDWLCAQTVYAEFDRHIRSADQTAYGALVRHEAVCAGYAGAFKLLCDLYSIPCIHIEGMAGAPHAWNYVQLDGSWYAVDTTWDDLDEDWWYKNFMRGSCFYENHTPEPLDFSVPILSENNYATFLYRGNGAGVAIVDYTGNETEINIPATIDGKSVTAISSSAFRDSNIISVYIPDGVTDIDNSAFLGCRQLTNVRLPQSLLCIGKEAFLGCSSLTDLELPQSLTTIGLGAFYGCDNLTELTLPQKLSVIGDMAFCECCGICGEIKLPSTIQSIGSCAFREVNQVEFSFDGTEAQWKTLEIASDGFPPNTMIKFLGNAAPSLTPKPTATIRPSESAAPSQSVRPSASASISVQPSASTGSSTIPAATATSTVMPTTSARPTDTAEPTAHPTNTAESTTVTQSTADPSERPAPNVPDVPGYQTGLVGGSTSCVKLSGSSTMFYLQNASGKMERVAVPYIKDSSGKRWYPLNHGGTALFPRLENDKVTCYCVFKDGIEIPVVNVAAAPAPVITGGYQTGTVGGRTYYVKVSGSNMMFYLRSASGKMERVAVPYVKDSSGKRWYPANHGGTALFPKLTNGKISYTTGSGETVLLAV